MVYRPNVEATSCFVLMPFQEPHLEYFTGIIQPAARAAGLNALKADDIYGTAPIIQDIWNQIWKARAVVADVTDRNPNVNYELGICHALGAPTVLITQTLADVPFDYRHIRCIVYDTKRINWEDKLRFAITETLKTLLAGFDPNEDLRWPYDTNILQAMKNVRSLVPANEGTESVTKGAALVREACSIALGPHGTNISLNRAFGYSQFDRSGVVIAGPINPPDPLQRKGIEHSLRLAQEVNAAVGDGSKTAILIFDELIKRGYSALQEGAVARDLIHEMDAAIESAVTKIQGCSWAAKGTDVSAAARTAAAGDAQVGNMIADALAKTGRDGIVSLLESADAKTSVDIRNGIHFNRGFLSTRFITDEARQIAELSDASILLYAGKISTMKPLLPVLEQVAKMKRPLLVIGADVEGEALETLAVNKERRTISTVAVRAPITAESGESLLEDIAVATGGTVISPYSDLDDVRLAHLGRAKHVEVSKDGCWITGGAGESDAIEARAAALRQQIEIAKGDFDSEKLQFRLANLVGNVCAIRVGGASSLDRAERMYKTRSAMHSARATIASGLVAGGGTALHRAARELRRQLGPAEIVARALEAPIRQQIVNARQDEKTILAQLDQIESDSVGFDAESRRIVDMRDAGIVDPSTVSVTAVQLAFAHARAILQTGVWDLTDRTASQLTESTFR